MKRFFCSECKRMKRAQQWPADIEDVDSTHPDMRIGTCNYHYRQPHVVVASKSVSSTKSKTAKAS